MLNTVKVISTKLNSIGQRIIKFLRYGLSDIQTAEEYGPHGFDSNPVKNMIALYAETGQKGETVIIGYLVKSKLAEAGEARMFSTDADGALKTFIWLKADGTMQLGGTDDFAVSFNNLKTEFNELQSKWNAFAAAYVPGSPALQGTPPTAGQSSANIDNAKNAKIKTVSP